MTCFLTSKDYKQSNSDHFLFILHKASYFSAILLYMDEVTLTFNNLYEIERIKFTRDDEFKIKDLGRLK